MKWSNSRDPSNRRTMVIVNDNGDCWLYTRHNPNHVWPAPTKLIPVVET